MLTDQIQSDLKQAQLDRNEAKVSTLRLLISEIKNAQISKMGELSDQDVISVIQKEAKKRKEAAAGFRSGNREEAALKEEEELKILESYLPAQLSDEELAKIVQDAVSQTGAASLSDMGKVIGMVMGKVAGKADGGRVSQIAKEQLVGK